METQFEEFTSNFPSCPLDSVHKYIYVCPQEDSWSSEDQRDVDVFQGM